MYENIFDTHAHYSDSAFDADREEILNSMKDKGVKYIMLASSCTEDNISNQTLAENYDFIYSATGFHPECADSVPHDYVDIIKNNVSRYPKIRAIGEIGLDYHYDGFDREKQIELFEKQLETANELELPVIVHSREATEDTVNIIKKYRPRGILHCFSGSAETAEEILKLGMYIGFSGVITFKNAKKAIRALETVPVDRLLLETDCPYMSPVPFRGRRCDSSMIAYTAEKMAEIKGKDVQEIINITCENAMRIYNINQ